MIFQPPTLSEKELDIIRQIGVLKERLGYQLRNTPGRWYDVLSRVSLARAIRGSNTIEGYNITKDDAVAVVDGDEPFDEKTESWFANECYKRAMTYVLQLANDPYFQYSEHLIKSLHFIMLEYKLDKMPGKWRPGYISVVNDLTKQIVYVGPDVELVPELMSEFVKYLNNTSKDMPSLIHAAMAHLNLTMIHPFKDGNGRMARCMQTLVLVRDGTLAGQFSSIEEYLGKPANTQKYYEVLAKVGDGKWQPERDALLWVQFCLNAHYAQAMTMLKRTNEMEKIWVRLEEEVKKKNLPERSMIALCDATLGYRVRNTSYRKMADIEDQVASRDLKRFVDVGFLVPQSKARGRYYVASEILNKIREEYQDKTEITLPFEI